MEYAAFEELKTARLHLRKLKMEDAQQYNRFAGSETVTRFMLWKPHKNISESEASIEKTLLRYEKGKYYRWAIALAEDDQLIGIIDLLGFNEEKNTCSFAYMIGDEFWGRGFGTQALRAALDFAFEKLKVAAVEADHMAANPASGAVMRKAGMTFVRTDEGKYEKNGCVYDAPVYRITREQWKK